jgi:hypothetical protein
MKRSEPGKIPGASEKPGLAESVARVEARSTTRVYSGAVSCDNHPRVTA